MMKPIIFSFLTVLFLVSLLIHIPLAAVDITFTVLFLYILVRTYIVLFSTDRTLHPLPGDFFTVTLLLFMCLFIAVKEILYGISEPGLIVRYLLENSHTGSDAGLVFIYLLFTGLSVIAIRKIVKQYSLYERFTLDSLPGKQMAIDADIANDVITIDEAVYKRKAIREDAEFFSNIVGFSTFHHYIFLAVLALFIITLVFGTVMTVIGYKMFDPWLINFIQNIAMYSLITGAVIMTAVINLFIIADRHMHRRE